MYVLDFILYKNTKNSPSLQPFHLPSRPQKPQDSSPILRFRPQDTGENGLSCGSEAEQELLEGTEGRKGAGTVGGGDASDGVKLVEDFRDGAERNLRDIPCPGGCR